jgi:hypothetical protein
MLGVSYQQNVLGGTKNNLFSRIKRLQDFQQRRQDTARRRTPQGTDSTNFVEEDIQAQARGLVEQMERAFSGTACAERFLELR